MKITPILTFLLISLLVAFSSCGNDDDFKPGPGQMLVAHSWQQSRISINGSTDQQANELIFKFNTDGSLLITTTDEKGNRTLQHGKWELSADASQLTLIQDGNREAVTIRELKENSLKLTRQQSGQTVEIDLVPASGVDFMPAG